MIYHSAKEILQQCQETNLPLHQLSLNAECQLTGKSPEDIRIYLGDVLATMFEAIELGLDAAHPEYRGKIIGDDGIKLAKREMPLCGETISKAAQYALSTMKVNAGMGRIVASPTAGSCGVMPAVLKTLSEQLTLSETDLINGLLVANIIGSIVARNATISGAEGGCQAEVGTASAMAAGAAVYLAGGTAEQVFHAGAMAFKNLLGLVCDPIAGLVESPCAKRNAMGATNALLCAEMSLAGIESIVPFDEVVEAMRRVGQVMPVALRETALGGLAATPTAVQITTDLFKTSSTL
ncbi:L-serine ammonia-lyase, iron-sulfur-dependent, subunit alpha [Fusibacter paucivorans]|uniref:L-serine dehydratase n=1 Tax=Fusibacter paucivorans TaxID=76009 RepID=A0ABS5PT35_9FIRM|nr:L-serine ammonia-lyase, iron-sulfur-dependent, subunit alpha [Fusibacter paucivorans]MBS7528037.1 L-serine ammonia-lyase, iron-sulfur-dependent, subunit alpha [Fusibacter paucivorans]